MATASINVKLGKAGAPGQYDTNFVGGSGDIVALAAAAVAAAPSSATVAADIATLVADGATPTQAHVNTLNTDWGTFLTALTAYEAAVASVNSSVGNGDVTVIVNQANVTKTIHLQALLRSILQRIGGLGIVS